MLTDYPPTLVDWVTARREDACLLVITTSDPAHAALFDSAPRLELRPLTDVDLVSVIRLYARDADEEQARTAAADSGGVPSRLHEAAAAWASARAEARIRHASADLHAQHQLLRLGQSEVRAGLLDLGQVRYAAAMDEPVADGVVCPYKGLARYERDDAVFFCGRDHAVAELITRLIGMPLLAVVGLPAAANPR